VKVRRNTPKEKELIDMKGKEKTKVVTGITRSDYFELLKKISKPVKPDKEKKPDKEDSKT